MLCAPNPGPDQINPFGSLGNANASPLGPRLQRSVTARSSSWVDPAFSHSVVSEFSWLSRPRGGAALFLLTPHLLRCASFVIVNTRFRTPKGDASQCLLWTARPSAVQVTGRTAWRTISTRRTYPLVAPYVHSTEATLRAWRHQGRGPAYYKDASGQITYRKSDLDAFNEMRKPRRIVPWTNEGEQRNGVASARRPVLPPEAIAERTGKNYDTITAAIRAGALKGVKIGRRSIGVRASEVQRWLDALELAIQSVCKAGAQRHETATRRGGRLNASAQYAACGYLGGVRSCDRTMRAMRRVASGRIEMHAIAKKIAARVQPAAKRKSVMERTVPQKAAVYKAGVAIDHTFGDGDDNLRQHILRIT